MDNISFKNNTNAIISYCHICNRPIQSRQIMHIDSLDNISRKIYTVGFIIVQISNNARKRNSITGYTRNVC